MLVSATVELCAADPHTFWLPDIALMAQRTRRSPSTAACDGHSLEAWRARTLVAGLITLVAAGQEATTCLFTVRYRLFAALSGLLEDIDQCCFATGAVRDNIGRGRTVGLALILGMTSLLALMLAAVEISSTNTLAFE